MCEQDGHIGSRVGSGFEHAGHVVGNDTNVRLEVPSTARCVPTSDLSRRKFIMVEAKGLIKMIGAPPLPQLM